MNWERQEKSSHEAKTLQEIIKAGDALKLFLEDSVASTEYPLPHGMHRLDKDYSDRELVNICCLVDTGREFAIDTHYLK